MAKLKPFEIIRGDTILIARTVKLDGLVIAGGIAGWLVFVTIKADLADDDSAALLKHDYTIPVGTDADASIFRFEVPQSKTTLLPVTTVAQAQDTALLPWLDVQIVRPRISDEPFVKTQRCQCIIYADATRRIAP